MATDEGIDDRGMTNSRASTGRIQPAAFASPLSSVAWKCGRLSLATIFSSGSSQRTPCWTLALATARVHQQHCRGTQICARLSKPGDRIESGRGRHDVVFRTPAQPWSPGADSVDVVFTSNFLNTFPARQALAHCGAEAYRVLRPARIADCAGSQHPVCIRSLLGLCRSSIAFERSFAR